MIPTIDPNHQVEALALLTDQFKKKPVIEGMIKAFSQRVQEIENALFDYLAKIPLAGAVGDVLDKYAAIVKISRDGQSDDDLRTAIYLQIRILRSQGRAEDIIQVIAMVLAVFRYDEYYPAGFLVTSFEVANPKPILKYAGRAKAAGTRGVFEYTTWPESTTLVWGTTVGSAPNAKGFANYGTGLPPNSMASAQEFSR